MWTPLSGPLHICYAVGPLGSLTIFTMVHPGPVKSFEDLEMVDPIRGLPIFPSGTSRPGRRD